MGLRLRAYASERAEPFEFTLNGGGGLAFLRRVKRLRATFYEVIKDMAKRKIRALLAKPGLDGHDRGAKVVAHAMREAGMEVVYTGLHQTVPSIVNQAIQEDVDVIGLSIMSGAHIPICRKLMGILKDKDVGDKLVVVGGVIPNKDIPVLEEMGVSGVFPGGVHFDKIVEFIGENVAK